MSKMDRTLSRTPEDVERKHGLSRGYSQGLSPKLEMQIQQLSSTLTQFIADTKNSISTINKTITELKDEAPEETVLYHITFYGADGVVVAAYVIKPQDKINSPIADVTWVDASGVAVTFPYTPTSDTNLYVKTESTQ